MAEPRSIFDEIDEQEEARAIAEAEAEIDAGKGVPHEKVREWLRKLAAGEIYIAQHSTITGRIRRGSARSSRSPNNER
jgi:hypothetical protein